MSGDWAANFPLLSKPRVENFCWKFYVASTCPSSRSTAATSGVEEDIHIVHPSIWLLPMISKKYMVSKEGVRVA